MELDGFIVLLIRYNKKLDGVYNSNAIQDHLLYKLSTRNYADKDENGY